MLAVLGGGISGLASAYYLLKSIQCHASNIIVAEASSRIGGWMRSNRSPQGNIFEIGPHTIRPSGVAGINTLDLVDDIGLTHKVIPIPRGHPATQNRFVFVNGKLHKLPTNIGSLVQTTPPFKRPLFSAVMQDLRTPKKECEDESIYDFVCRRLGKDIAEYGVDPLVRGVCAGNAREISVQFLMRELFNAEQTYGSITRGTVSNMFKMKKPLQASSELAKKALNEKWSVWTLKGGLQTLPNYLHKYLEHCSVQMLLNAPCTSLKFTAKEKVDVEIGDKVHSCEHVISTIPAYKLGELLVEEHSELSNMLTSIPFVTVGVVNLEYKGNVLKEDGFGFLVPSNQGVPILGVIFDSCVLSQKDHTILTVMMGGSWFKELFGDEPNKEQLLEVALKQLNDILGISSVPRCHNVSILKQCIPQYVVGHYNKVNDIRNYIRMHKLPLSIAGSSFDGVSVNDVIISAKTAVDSCGYRGSKAY